MPSDTKKRNKERRKNEDKKPPSLCTMFDDYAMDSGDFRRHPLDTR